jgi:hypothetical protein
MARRPTQKRLSNSGSASKNVQNQAVMHRLDQVAIARRGLSLAYFSHSMKQAGLTILWALNAVNRKHGSLPR